ncbi:6-phospho-3-hexuloisomerase [Actinomadura viridis]
MDRVHAERPHPWQAAVAELAEVSGSIDAAEFARLLEELEDPARRCFLSGQGRSGLVAGMVAMRLMHIGRTCHVAGEATAPAVRRGDVLIVISGSGTTPASVRHAESARAEGATVIAVTRPGGGALAGIADLTLRIPAGASAQLGGNLFEQAALIALDGLVNALAAGVPDARGRLRRRHANL